jgi:signal transduction histidine kinase
MTYIKSKSLLLLFFLLFFCNNFAQGQLQQINRELQRLSFIKDSVSLVNSLNRLGILYRSRNADSCFYYGVSAKRIATHLRYIKGQKDADQLIAYAFFKRGLYAESLDLLGKTLPYYQETKDTERIIRVNLDMIEVLNKGISDRAKIRALLQKAIQTGRKLEKDSIMSEVYVSYCNRNPYLTTDSINYYLSKSVEIAMRYKDERMLIYIRLWQVRLLILAKKKQEALPLIKRLISDSRRIGNASMEINSLFLMTGYYDDRPKIALDYFYRAYEVAQKSGDRSIEIYVLNNALEVANQLGDKDEIINVHIKLEKAMSADWEKTKKFISDYVRYNAVQDDNKLLNKKNAQQTGYLIVFGISLIIVVLALLRVWHNRKRLLELNKRIREQNSNMQKTLYALEQSQADNTHMMQIVAHDLRNPIGGMYSIVSFMLDQDGRTGEDKEYLEMLKTTGKVSLELVNDLLLAHTKIDDLKKEPVDLVEMLQYCVGLLRHKAALKEQQIHLRAGTVISIQANQEKLWRVVSNLIANAIKFSSKGASIHVDLQKKADHVCIAVKDNGIGIPKEIASKIFDMFTDAKRPGTTGEQSFGLGLAISKQIVEAHGGKLWFESEVEHGTVFYVELPIT